MTNHPLQRLKPLNSTKIVDHAVKPRKRYFSQLAIDFRREKEVADHAQEGPYRAGGHTNILF